MPTGPGYRSTAGDVEARDGLPSSLASYRESLRSSRPRCERKLNLWLVNQATGEFMPLGCGRMTCPQCVGWLAVRTAGAVGLAEPQRFGRLSLVGNDWQTVRARMSRLRYDLRKALRQDFEWAWNVEQNPKGTGHHVHFFQHGAFVPQRLLAELADYRGMGRNVDIRQWKPQGSLSTAYGLKGLLYPMKGALDEREGQDDEVLNGFLAINGRRLIHASRGYFRHCGEHLGLEDARRKWSVVRRGATEPDPWGVRYCPAWERGKSK